MNLAEWFARQPLFNLGSIYVTGDIDRFLVKDELKALLKHHQCGDWSEMTEEDRRENEFSVDKDLRIFSSYLVRDEKIWVITEADRSLTTVLFPHEY